MLAAMSDAIEHGFKEGDKVWVEDGPSAYVVHPEAHQAEVVSVFRITPRDE